ncbi:hypothetical protein [Mycolicibacterium sp.]|uniref:hypothetical protein n=1 Tax=Mycolicibacterium sp. TaxID=2320850 RepID=UPI0037C6F403
MSEATRERLTEALREHRYVPGWGALKQGDCWAKDCHWRGFDDDHAAHLVDVLLSLPDIQIDEANAERGTGEYLALRYADYPVEAFDLFVKYWVPPKWHAHLADTDDNDAEFVRRHIRASSSSTTGARGVDR